MCSVKNNSNNGTTSLHTKSADKYLLSRFQNAGASKQPVQAGSLRAIAAATSSGWSHSLQTQRSTGTTSRRLSVLVTRESTWALKGQLQRLVCTPSGLAVLQPINREFKTHTKKAFLAGILLLVTHLFTPKLLKVEAILKMCFIFACCLLPEDFTRRRTWQSLSLSVSSWSKSITTKKHSSKATKLSVTCLPVPWQGLQGLSEHCLHTNWILKDHNYAVLWKLIFTNIAEVCRGVNQEYTLLPLEVTK